MAQELTMLKTLWQYLCQNQPTNAQAKVLGHTNRQTITKVINGEPNI